MLHSSALDSAKAAISLALSMASIAAQSAVLVCTDEAGRRFTLRQEIGSASTLLRCAVAEESETRVSIFPLPRSISIPLDVPEVLPPAPSFRTPPAEIDGLIAQVAHDYGHDARLLKSIVFVESGFNPRALSPKGAVGLMQLIPSTAQRYGVSDASRELYDPRTNLQVGARYLADLKRMFPHQLSLVLAAYNAGEGAVLKHGGIPPFDETRAYVKRVLSVYGKLVSQSPVAAY